MAAAAVLGTPVLGTPGCSSAADGLSDACAAPADSGMESAERPAADAGAAQAHAERCAPPAQSPACVPAAPPLQPRAPAAPAASPDAAETAAARPRGPAGGAKHSHSGSHGDAPAWSTGWLASAAVFSSRTLALSGFPPAVEDAHILAVARRYGAVRWLHSEGRALGVVLVSFYDVRHAEAAAASLAAGGWPEAGAWLSATLVPPPEHTPGMENQGTLVLSGWPADGVSAAPSHAELAALLETFGDVRALRPAPHASGLQFAEFCDTRCAAAALDALNAAPGPLRPGLPRLQAEYGRMPPPRRSPSGGAGVSAFSTGPPATPWAATPYMVPLLPMHHPGAGCPPGHGHHGHHPLAWAPHHHHQHAAAAAAAAEAELYYTGADGYNYYRGGGAYGYGGSEVVAPRSPRGGAPAHPLCHGGRSGRRAMNRSRGGSSDDSDLCSPNPSSSSGGSAGAGAGSAGSGGAARSGGGGGAAAEARDAVRFAFCPAEAAAPGGRTTLMLRNIPNKCTRPALLAALAAAGTPARAYDFVYLPVDFKHRCNLGYAFLNMTSPAAAGELHAAFHGRPWPEFRSRKVCAVTYARVQGRAALVAHFRASRFPADSDDALPLLLHHAPDGEPDAPPRTEVVGTRIAPPPLGAPSSAGGTPRRSAAAAAAAAAAGLDTCSSEGASVDADSSTGPDSERSGTVVSPEVQLRALDLAPAGAEEEEAACDEAQPSPQ